MEFRKLVSVLCSATCAVGGVSAKPSGGMKEKIAQMKKESEEKGSKSLVTFGNFARYSLFGEFSGEGKEILKARGVSGLLNGEVVSDVMEDLEVLGRDPEARKKVLELANSYKVRSLVKRFFSKFAMFGSGLAFTVGAIYLLSTFLLECDCVRSAELDDLHDLAEKLYVSYVESDTKEDIINKLRRRLVIAGVVCLAVGFGLTPAHLALYFSFEKCQGIKEALEKLVKESEGMQNQAVAPVSKLKEKKSGSSASKGDSRKSGEGSGKSKKRGKSEKVKAEKAGNSAKNDNLVLN